MIISVVIPYYNDSLYIEECLKSICAQTGLSNVKFECIIVDDNSNDKNDLKLILDHFYNPIVDIKYFRNEKNFGGGYSRNIGINNATGTYITFLDADDFWLKEKILLQLNTYTEGTVLTSSVLKGGNIKTAIKTPLEVKINNESVSDALFINNRLIQTSTFFMSSDIAKDLMFNPSLPRHQDYDFLLRGEYKGYKVVQMDEALSFWRVTDDYSGRFLKKKASPEFFIEWYKEYKKYMSTKAAIAYVAKNIFSACMITKKYYLFISFILSDSFSFSERIQVIKGILSWRWEKFKK